MIKTNSNLREKLNKIPELPGIYKFFDADKRIIYIGKSICLKKRVSSYFADNPKWEKVKRMIAFIDDMEFIVTDTHLEARLLECELIKSIKPLFNTQMKNDERYAYLKIEEYNLYNPISIKYIREENSFGPFRRKYSLYKMIELLKNLYPIYKINGIYKFEYKLFPVAMDRPSYETNKESLLEILSDELTMDLFIKDIEIKMKEAASMYKFETASLFRDIIFSLNYLKSGIMGYKNLFSKNIVLRIPFKGGIKLFFVSRGQMVLKKTYKRLSDKSYSLFIENGIKFSNKLTPLINEKMSIDYRDILYSEIIALPEHMVNIL